MSFGSFEKNQSEVIAEINTTPLIDVLLVLLVIFLVTLPLTTASVPVSLPKANAAPTRMEMKVQVITIDADNKLFWGDEISSLSEIDQRFASLSVAQPSLRLRVDARATFDIVAKVLASAERHHLTHVEFVTEQTERPKKS